MINGFKVLVETHSEYMNYRSMNYNKKIEKETIRLYMNIVEEGILEMDRLIA